MAGKTLTDASPSRRALHALGIFGGVKSVTLLFSIIKVKLVALWLGAEGMGLYNILTSATDTVASLSQLSIGSSAVKFIASARDPETLKRTAAAVGRLSWIAGIAGAFLMLTAADTFSRMTFGDSSHTVQFRWLAVSVFLSAITGGLLAVTQGSGNLRALAKARLWGAVVSFVISVPLFYFYRLDAILPVLTLGFSLSAVTACIYRTRIDSPGGRPGWPDSLGRGREMVKLGLFMTISAFAGMAVNYLLIAWLNAYASTATVGYYNAGYTLANRYTGILFAAVATEYYPRLAGIIDDPAKVEHHVSEQMKLGLRILLPVILLFISFDRLAVWVLYSSDFEVILPYVTLAVSATLLKLTGWCYSYVILARGDGRMYALTELAGQAVYLVATIAGYTLYGMAGLGYATLLSLLFDACLTLGVSRFSYGYRTGRSVWLLLAASLAVTALALILRRYAGPLPVILLAVPAAIISLRGIRKSV